MDYYEWQVYIFRQKRIDDHRGGTMYVVSLNCNSASKLMGSNKSLLNITNSCGQVVVPRSKPAYVVSTNGQAVSNMGNGQHA